jgi:hypothetical protein
MKSRSDFSALRIYTCTMTKQTYHSIGYDHLKDSWTNVSVFYMIQVDVNVARCKVMSNK